MFKLIIKLISDLIGPVNFKKSLMKQIDPSVLRIDVVFETPLGRKQAAGAAYEGGW